MVNISGRVRFKGEVKMEQPIFVTGKCYWAEIINPCTRFDEDFWGMNILVDDDNRELIEEAGFKIHSDERHPTDYIKTKLNYINKAKGRPNTPPTVLDSQKNPWDESTLIGNNSLVTAKIIPNPWKRDKRSGVSATLRSVQVLELVPYLDSGGDFPVVEGGYVNENLESAPF